MICMSKKFALILGILFFFILSTNARAATYISSCPYTITSSGDYIVTNNLYYSGSETCISVLASNVNIYCQNYLINGNEMGRGIGIVASDHIYVYNCYVWNFEKSIDIQQSTYVSVRDSDLKSSVYGAYVESSNNVGFYNVISEDNTYGILLNNTNSSSIQNSTILRNSHGIELWGSNVITVSYTDAYYNSFGLLAYLGNNIDIAGNRFSRNDYGLRFQVVSSSTVRDNKLEENTQYGFAILNNVQGNRIYNNLFRNNNNVLIMDSLLNYWNTTKQIGTRIYGAGYGYIGGNYWSNPSGTGYSDTCPNTDYDDFCDSPYTIATNNIDKLPLASVSNITLEIQVTQQKCHLDADGCEQDVPSPTITIKDIYGNVVASGTTNIQKSDCYVCGALKKPCYIARFNLLPAERYLVVISKSGYRTLEANASAYYSASYKFYLPRENEFTIGIKVKDGKTLQPITTVTRCLFYQNGTKVPDLYSNALFCAQLSNDGGRYDYYCVPGDSYYFTIQASNYQTYTSDIFYLDSDIEKIVYLSPFVYVPACGNGICEANETVENCPQDCAKMGAIPQINVTEWQELGYGWLLPLFSPFALYNLMMIFIALIGGVITREPSVVLGIILVFIVIFVFIGVYPIWLAFVLIIIAGFLFVRLVGHIFVRG